MATVSRNMPPRAAVTTIMPAVGGPSSTTFHSSGEKAAFVVMPRSCVQGLRLRTEVKDLAFLVMRPRPVRVNRLGHNQVRARRPAVHPPGGDEPLFTCNGFPAQVGGARVPDCLRRQGADVPPSLPSRLTSDIRFRNV